MKTVRVALGYTNVPLPDGRTYNPGPLIQLSDADYDSLPDFIKKQLVVVLNNPGAPAIPTSQSFTHGLIYDLLASMGVGLMLTWDGADYQPSAYKSANDRIKIFVGPTDPSTVTGAVMNNNDQWITAD